MEAYFVMEPDQVIKELKVLTGRMPAWSPSEQDPDSKYMHARWIKWSAQQELIDAYAGKMRESKAAEQKSKSDSTDPIRSKDYIGSPSRGSLR